MTVEYAKGYERIYEGILEMCRENGKPYITEREALEIVSQHIDLFPDETGLNRILSVMQTSRGLIQRIAKPATLEEPIIIPLKKIKNG